MEAAEMLRALLDYLRMPFHIAKLGWGFITQVNISGEPLRSHPFTPIRSWEEEIEILDREQDRIMKWVADQKEDVGWGSWGGDDPMNDFSDEEDVYEAFSVDEEELHYLDWLSTQYWGDDEDVDAIGEDDALFNCPKCHMRHGPNECEVP